MTQESKVDGLEAIRRLQASFLAYWAAQNLEDKTSFPLPRERQDIADLLAIIDKLQPSHDSMLAALEAHGCELSRNDKPPCIDERPAKKHWCDTCLAIDKARG